MTQEEIDQVARAYSALIVGGIRHIQDFYEREKYEAGFISGANWRIDSVWHDMCEEPKKEEMLLLHGNGRTISILWNGDIKWKDIGKFFRAEKWAYMKDLLPIRRTENE